MLCNLCLLVYVQLARECTQQKEEEGFNLCLNIYIPWGAKAFA